MKRKIILMLLMVVMVACFCAISVSAASLSNFVDVKLTLVDGTEATAYMSDGVSWNGYQGYDRRNLYKSYEDTSETYAWIDVQIFDMRESQIYTYDSTNGKVATGTYPVTLLQHPSNPNNVTHFYYPQGSVIVADSSFATGYGWTSLEYLWIPNSVEIIGQFICKEAGALETVEIEDGSHLKEVRKEAFKGCSNLTSFDFPETVTTIGYCAFYQAGLSGKVVLPNAVTSIGDAAFRTTKIETLVIGDGPVSLGYNLVGNETTDSSHLKEIYIPIEATFVKASETWYESTNDTGLIKFYVIADEGEDCSEFITTLKGTGRVTFATQAEIDAGTATSGYNAVIIEGYNKCDAFYNGEHIEVDDSNCTTDNLCLNCKRLETAALEAHAIESAIEYKDGFASAGTIIKVCVNDGCETVDGEEIEALAIFSAIGYSTNAEQTALCGGYSVAKNAYDTYTQIAKGQLKFGLIIANASSFAEGVEMLDANGRLTTDKGLQVEMTSSEYTNLNCSIYNFDELSMSNLNLIITMYVIAPDGSISYIQADVSYANEAKIGTRSFDSVTMYLVINKPVATVPSNSDEQ